MLKFVKGDFMVGIYFSGTGNTKYCVEKFMQEYSGISGGAYSIEDKESIVQIQKHKRIVIGYPVQYSNIPKIVKDFILQNKSIWKGKEIYIIVTMGLFSGDGAGILARFLEQSGGKTLGGLHLKMPDSICDEKVLKRTVEKNKLLIARADEKIKRAVENVKKGGFSQDGIGLISHIAGLFGQRLYFYNKTKGYSDKLKIDRQKCIGCGICVKLCPMQNIKLNTHIAEASDRCTLCYRCVNKCPKQAITLLGKKVARRYRNIPAMQFRPRSTRPRCLEHRLRFP